MDIFFSWCAALISVSELVLPTSHGHLSLFLHFPSGPGEALGLGILLAFTCLLATQPVIQSVEGVADVFYEGRRDFATWVKTGTERRINCG